MVGVSSRGGSTRTRTASSTGGRGASSYYHVHDRAAHAAGHFHTVRLFPDRTAHLVGISMAPTGWPQALFTLNFWAIGDAEESPDDLKRYARRFLIDERRGDPRLIRFINLVTRAFRPEIESLHDAKAAALAEYRRAHPGADPAEDRSLEVVSQTAIDVKAHAASTPVVV